MRQTHAYIELARPVNVLIAAASVLVGALVAGPAHFSLRIPLACLVAALITGGANAINDVYDLEIDRINKPGRPLPSGRVNSLQGFLYGSCLLVLGMVASSLLGLSGVIIALVASFLLVVYSAWLKRSLLLGNLTVALVSALAFLYGGIAVRQVSQALVPAVFAFLFHLGREILKDAQDEEGDKIFAARTLPVVIGVPGALRWMSLVFGLLILATVFPYLVGLYSLAYLMVAILGVDLPLVYVIFSSQRNLSHGHLGRMSLLLKVAMGLGLVALLLGRWGS